MGAIDKALAELKATGRMTEKRRKGREPSDAGQG
jgi:hypothetical protein